LFAYFSDFPAVGIVMARASASALQSQIGFNPLAWTAAFSALASWLFDFYSEGQIKSLYVRDVNLRLHKVNAGINIAGHGQNYH
jgi:hypothetical protein